jgi:hypothetical protein
LRFPDHLDTTRHSLSREFAVKFWIVFWGCFLSGVVRADYLLPGLVWRELIRSDYREPEFLYSTLEDSPYGPAINDSVFQLKEFAHRLSSSLLLPGEIRGNILTRATRGKHYLEAHCFPFTDEIVMDESTWNYVPIVPKGLLGHEFGHLLFRRNVMALLENEFGRNSAPSMDRLLNFLKTDTAALDAMIREFENQYPALRLLTSGTPVDVRQDVYGYYQTFVAIRRAHEGYYSIPPLTGDKLFQHVLLESMGGLQEVFSDLVGAIYTGRPDYLTEILNTRLSRTVRNFSAGDVLSEVSGDAELRRQIITSASKGIPHNLLLQLRQNIYRKFYLQNGFRMGESEAYDDKVLQRVLESFTRVFVRVYRRDPPKTREAAAALAWIYKEVIGDLEYQIEIDARAIVTHYRVVKVTPLHLPACLEEVKRRGDVVEERVQVRARSQGNTNTRSHGQGGASY